MAASSRRSLAIVFAVVFLDLLGFGIIIPILPYYTRSFPGGTAGPPDRNAGRTAGAATGRSRPRPLK